MKQKISLLLAVIMLLTTLPLIAFADDDGYVIDEGVLTVTSDEGLTNCKDDEDYSSITAIVIEGTVTEIPANTFSAITALTSLTIEDGVQYIGKNAFNIGNYYEYPDYLESIVLNAEETELKIDVDAFAGYVYSDSVLTVPENVTILVGHAAPETATGLRGYFGPMVLNNYSALYGAVSATSTNVSMNADYVANLILGQHLDIDEETISEGLGCAHSDGITHELALNFYESIVIDLDEYDLSYAGDISIKADANVSIIGEGAFSMNNLIIEEGASLTISEGVALIVNDTLTNSGTLADKSNSLAAAALADIDSWDATDDYDAIMDAASLITMLDSADLATDSDLVLALNKLDALFIEAHESISVLAVVPTIDAEIDETDKLPELEITPEGLALAVLGHETPNTDNTYDFRLNISQNASEDEAVVISVAPQLSTDKGVSYTDIDNATLQSPVSFKVYLPSSFDDEAEFADVLHESAGYEDMTYTLAIEEDDNGRYIFVTLTHFSTLSITVAADNDGDGVLDGNVNTGSSTTYYRISVSKTGEGTISPSGGSNGYVSVRRFGSQTFNFSPANGYEVSDVLVNGKSVGAVSSYTFSMLTSSRTLKVEFSATDMDTDAYYYEAYNWASDNDFFDGIDFSVNADCDRATAARLLWNVLGQPEYSITKNPFSDMDEDDDFYDAVMWAYENKVILGTTTTTFSPDETCTRAQIFTMMYRFAGDEFEVTDNPFKDVATHMYYYQPVLWAVANELTYGTSDTTFSPNKTCSHAEIITLMYRHYA